MAALRDYLSPEAKAKYPDEYLTPQGRALLDIQIPADYPGSRAQAYAAKVESALPHLTIVAAAVRHAQRHFGEPVPDAVTPESIEAGTTATFRRMNPVARGAMQFGAGVNETLPSPNERPLFSTAATPAPAGMGERLARAAGSMVTFGAEAAPIALATAGAGVTPIVSQALAAGLPALAQPGSVKRRLVRGGIMAGAGAGSAVVGAVAGQVARGVGELQAPEFAAAVERTAAEQGPEAGAKMLAAGANTARANVLRTSQIAEDVGGAALFGGVAPYAEHAALKKIGEPSEAPKAEDVLAGIGGMALMGLAHGAGARAFEARSGPAAPETGAPPAPDNLLPGGGGAPTAPPEAVETPSTSLATRQQRQPLPIPPSARPAVLGILKGNGTTGPAGRLDNTKRNPLDGNRTAFESWRDRITAANPQTDADWQASAATARRQVVGMSDLYSKVAEPPGSNPALRAAGETQSQKWTDYLGGKGVVLVGPKGSEVGGRVAAVFVYPWSPQQFRVVLRDEQTGQIVARTYATAADFNNDIVSIGRPPRAAASKAAKPAKAAKAAVPAKELPLFAEPGGRAVEGQPVRETAPAPKAPAFMPEDVGAMTHEQITTAHATQAAHEKASVVRVFGAEGAKRYNELDRQRNSIHNTERADRAQDEIDKMEAPLTEAQKKDLFGIGEEGLNAEDLSAARRASSDYQPEMLHDESDGEIAASVGRAFIGRHALGNVADRIRMTRLMAEVKRRGWSADQVERAVKSEAERQRIEPDDAMLLARAAMERNRPAKPLEQQSLAVPPRELPRGPIVLKSRAAEGMSHASVAAMGGEAKSFGEHFADLVKRGDKPEDARAEAERLAGSAAPSGFDAEARAKALLHAAAEDAGQGSLFGAPQPAPAARGEAVAVPERTPEGAPVRAVAETAGKAEAGTMRAQSLHFREEFQQRDTDAGLVDSEHVQQMLEKHGGYSHDELVKNPITVWTDEKGEVGPAGRTYVLSGHHRAYVAQRTWGTTEAGRFAETSISDREVPVVHFKGTHAEALAEAETSNLKGKPNTMVEKAGVARRLLDRGSSLKGVAAQVTGGKVAQAQDLINLSYLDPELQRQFFGEKGLPLNVGSFLGEFTKRYSVHPAHQRTWLEKLNSREISNSDELRDVVEGYLRILKAANQTELLSKQDMGDKAISPRLAHDYIGRVLKLVGKERRDADRARKDTEKLMQKGGSKELMKAAEVVLERHRLDLTRANRLDAEAQSRSLRAINEATEKGESIANALQRVKDWMDAQMRHDPNEMGAAPMFSDGVASRWLAKAIRRGVERATRRAAEAPRVAGGPRPEPPVFDDYSSLATTRMMAHTRLGNWQDILVPELQHSYITRGAAEVFIKRGIEDAWQKALGSDKGLEFFAEGGTGSRQLADALEGKKVTLPAEHRGVPAAVRTFLNELRELLNAHNAKTGQKPVAYRQDYLPHVVLGERSAPLSRLMELLELRSGTQMSEKEIEEYHDRFFDRRKGHPGYAKDATFAIKQYIHEAVKKLAWDEHLIATRKFLADASPADFDRANLIRDWTRSRFLQQKSTIGRNIDDLVSKMLFQHTMRGIEEIDLERAAKGAHTTVEDLKAQGIEKAYWVPPGVEYTAGTKSVDLGTWDGGRIVGAPKGDAVIATGSPIAHKWVRAAMHWKMGMPLLKIRNDEAWLRHRWKVERGLDDLQRSPSAMILGAITGRISSNIFWWNVGAAFINSTGPLLTTLPEYGLRAYAVGVYGTAKGVTRATVRAGLKAYVGAAERMGYLKPDQAEAARKSIPLLLEEVYAEASGVQQREMQMLEQRAADIADGKNPDVQAVLRALVYRGDVLFSTAEGLNRAQSIIAADHFARREFGVVRTVPQAFDSMEHARQEMLKALGDDGSPESFAARGTLLDQFAYDPGSFPMALSGAYGRTSFQLMRWTLAALKRYGLRPSEGAARVGYATMRGIKNAMLVESARSGPRAQRPGSREKLPPPKGWFEEWLDYNGANWQHRHAAAVFMRSTAIAAVLLGASIKAGIAFSNAGVPPHVMLALWLLRQFFQNDKDIQDWFEQGREGAMVSTNRLPVGPMAQGAVQFGGALGEAASQRGPVRLEKFPWESVMGTARLYLIRGQPEIARMMQAHPRWFEDHAPWAFKVFGVKTVMEDMTPAQQVKQQTRMLTAKERSELQRKP